jgi:hypothetical protein
MKSVLQDWVMELGLRHQGVMLCAVRGCDTAPKDDPSKLLCRCLRYAVLNCHCGDATKAVSFIELVSDDELHRRMVGFLKNCDHYPQHYVSHLMHAAEVIGYKHPDEWMRQRWIWFYCKLVSGLHLTPETESQLDARLLASEEHFGQMAQIA